MVKTPTVHRKNTGCSDPEANSGYDGPLCALFQVDKPIRENISMAAPYNM